MIRVGTVNDTAGFEALRDEWSELIEASASNRLFLTWEWLYTWWKHLGEGRRLSIITVRCGRELAAIAPLALRPPRLRRFLPFSALEFLGSGSVGSTYLDVIVRRGREREVLDVLAEHLGQGTRMLELTNLKRDACLAAALAARFRQRGWSTIESKVTICPRVDLSGHSWPSYLATIGPDHFQRNLKNLTKRFDVRFEQAVSEDERGQALQLLVDLHDRRWNDRGGSEAFHTPALRAFHEELSRLALQRDWLRLFVLRLDGKAAAALYGFRFKNTFYFYQSGFDPAYRKLSVGFIAVGLTIKRAIEDGATEYDLLGGDEPYKFRWVRDAYELSHLELYPPRGRGLLLRRAMAVRRTSERMVRRLVPDAWMGAGKPAHAAQPR